MAETVQNLNKLSVLISTRNDPVGTAITMRATLEEFKACDFPCELIIVDNSDLEGKSQMLHDLIYPYLNSGEAQLFTQPFPCLFSARELAAEKAIGEYLLFIDSHCIFYKDSLKNMVAKADSLDNLGLLFGSMCYSVSHHEDAFVDRGVEDILPIRKCEYDEECFQIPLRSMPFLIRSDLFKEMNGYAPLSTYFLVWGGGDFLISFKPLLLGYDNWILTSAGAVHLGPFHDRGFFISSYIKNTSHTYNRFTGMLTAAYVIGGPDLLETRIQQLSNRLSIPELRRLSHLATNFGEDERGKLSIASKRDYQSILSLYPNQGDYSVRKFQKHTDLMPRITKSSSFTSQSVKNGWRSRIAINRDHLKLKQSGARL